jgi:hypothetical protein
LDRLHVGRDEPELRVTLVDRVDEICIEVGPDRVRPLGDLPVELFR